MKTLDARYVRHCSGERQTFGVAVGGVSGLFSGACRCLVETRVIGRFPKNGKPWNRAKNDHM